MELQVKVLITVACFQCGGKVEIFSDLHEECDRCGAAPRLLKSLPCPAAMRKPDHPPFKQLHTSNRLGIMQLCNKTARSVQVSKASRRAAVVVRAQASQDVVSTCE